LRKANYKKLWKLLIDRDVNKKMLAEASGISMSSLAKMGRGETVTVETLVKICNALDCEISDIMDLVDAAELEKTPWRLNNGQN
jgi:DNA-binding Xre family transcriptional regulator